MVVHTNSDIKQEHVIYIDVDEDAAISSGNSSSSGNNNNAKDRIYATKRNKQVQEPESPQNELKAFLELALPLKIKEKKQKWYVCMYVYVTFT